MQIHDWTRAPTVSIFIRAGPSPFGMHSTPADCRQATSRWPSKHWWPNADVVTLALNPSPGLSPGGTGGQRAPPKTRFTTPDAFNTQESQPCCNQASDGNLVSVIEIVSPGNKIARCYSRVRAKAVDSLKRGPFVDCGFVSPNRRNPQGIHHVIWRRIRDEPPELPKDKPLTLAAYISGSAIAAHIEPVAVGDPLPDMPLYLRLRTISHVP